MLEWLEGKVELLLKVVHKLMTSALSLFSWPIVGMTGLDLLVPKHPCMNGSVCLQLTKPLIYPVLDIPLMPAYLFKMTLNLLYVGQSISWLTFLLKLDQYRNISSSGWGIFLKFFGDISRIFLDYLQIMLNFLYVC